MNRLALVEDSDASPDQQAVIAEFIAARGGRVPPGPLFRMIMNSPEAARRLGAVGAHCRAGLYLTPLVAEAAILGSVHELGFQVEVAAHERSARAAGMPPAIVAGLAARAHSGLPRKYRIAAAFARAAVRQQMTDALFAEAREHFGDRGVVELLVVAGYYAALQLISSALSDTDTVTPTNADRRPSFR